MIVALAACGGSEGPGLDSGSATATAVAGASEDREGVTAPGATPSGGSPPGQTPGGTSVAAGEGVALIAVDPDLSTAEFENEVPVVAIGETATVGIIIVASAGQYRGYQYRLEWPPEILEYQRQDNVSPELTLCAEPTIIGSSVYNGCIRIDEPTTYEGPVNTVDLTCIGKGEATLRLVPAFESELSTSLAKSGGVAVPTALQDAILRCE